ncbi:MAG: plastoquinol--plastocyanin reductase [Candidatus Zixiibacteriota bacterium]|nr:MAG: plastoquinol--plastocyanin reductase [candidate division Zixibacteria bacterium]HHI03562.1 ubiquinol-cytochrome c reductase iron-sulfur subunit [candidate division Zixibacteria bacterium]
MNDNNSRRDFLSWLTGLGSLAFLGSIFYPVYKFLIPPESTEAIVSQVKLPFTRSEIEGDEKKAKTFKFGRTLGLIILTGEGELKAMAATCTHLDCTVQHRPDLEIIWCSCHNGRYDLDGKNISGPPPRPLEKYVVNEIKGEIFVSKETT